MSAENKRAKIQNLIHQFIEDGNNKVFPNSRTLFVKEHITDIIELTSYLPESAKVIERLHIIHNSLTDSDLKCPMCEKRKKFYTFTKGYNVACSQSCATKYQQIYLVDRAEVSRKMVQTMQDKTPEEKEVMRKRRHETKLKLYGEDYAQNLGKIGYKNAVERGSFKSGFVTIRKDEKKWKEIHLKTAATLKSQIDENGNNHYHRMHLKKLNDIDKDGNNFYDREHLKKLNDIDKDGNNYYQRRHLKKLNDIDKDGNNFYDREHLKKLNDIDKDGNNFYDRVRLNNYKTGHWTDPRDMDNLRLYRWQVSRVMLRYKKEIEQLENFEKRGHANKGMYHLDHKFSVIEGFKNCMPPYIIGSIANLEMITGRNNLVKNRKCSITKEELFKDFEELNS